mgnify:FL=1
MQRRNFFKWVGGVLAALTLKPKPADAADVVIAPVQGFRMTDLPCAVFGSSMGGRTYYIDTWAAEDGDGTPERPFRSMGQLPSLKGGETIMIITRSNRVFFSSAPEVE